MADSVGGTSRSRLVWPAIFLGCCSAGLIWLLYALYGHLLVQGMYDRTLPFEWLNGIVKRQTQHPLDYYLVMADSAVRGVCLLLIGGAMVGAGLAEFARRRPDSPWSGRTQRVVIVSTLLVWAAFLLEAPLFPLLPHWVWSLHKSHLPAAWILLPAAALGLGSVRFVLRHPERWRLNLLMLIGAGYALQLAFAFSEGRGMDALSSQYLGGGHGRLARAATEQRSPLRLVTSYGQLLDTGELVSFPHATRPPGAVLFLVGMERLSRVWGEGEEGDSPPALERLSSMAAWTLPLLAYLTVIPLFGICRRLYGTSAAAWVAPSLYLFIPNVTLMTLHLDQCLFPLLAWTCVYTAVRGLDTGHPGWAVGAGVLLYLSLFVSFGLIALAPILLLLGLLWKRAGKEQQRLKATGLYSLLLGAGWLATYLTFHALFGYDAVAQFRFGMAAHQAFKVLDWTLSATLYFAGLDALEFALWCGPPVSVLAVAEMRRVLWTARRGLSALGGGTSDADAESLAAGRHHSVVLTFAIVISLLALFGKTAAETGRLWIFLVPLVLMAAAGALMRLRRGGDQWHRYLLLICALQFVTVLVLKRHQDFF